MQALNNNSTGLCDLIDVLTELRKREPICFDPETRLPEDETLESAGPDLSLEHRKMLAEMLQQTYGFHDLSSPFIIPDTPNLPEFVRVYQHVVFHPSLGITVDRPESTKNGEDDVLWVEYCMSASPRMGNYQIPDDLSSGTLSCYFTPDQFRDLIEFHQFPTLRMVQIGSVLSTNYHVHDDTVLSEVELAAMTRLQHNFAIWLRHQICVTLLGVYNSLSSYTQQQCRIRLRLDAPSCD